MSSVFNAKKAYMRYLLIVLFVFLNSIVAISQSDKFESYDSIVGKRVCFYDASKHIKELGKFLFVKNEKGKLVAVKDITPFQSLIKGEQMEALGIVVIKNKQYLQLKSSQEDFYFLVSEKYNCLPYFRSASYWLDKIEKYKKDYQFRVVNPNFFVDGIKSCKFGEVEWLNIVMPKHIDGVVEVVYEVEGVKVQEPFSAIAKEEFVTEIEVNKEKRRVERLINERREKERQEREDSIADYSVFTAKRYDKLISEDYHGESRQKGFYDVYVFKILGDEYTAWEFGSLKEGKVSELVFDAKDASCFLTRRGVKGVDVRSKLAYTADSLRVIKCQQHLDSLNKEIQRIKKETYNKIKKNQIFIHKELYSYSRYKFGKKFRFFNCFNKSIKYIEMTLVAYNAVGDVQRDDIGRSSVKLKGIGPIPPDEYGTYDWDELFWDDNDIIERVVPTKIAITFMDGTIRTFSGKSNIDKHRMYDCYQEED
jgi:hypothetical protein